jgi:hypothetical protein
MEDLCAEVAKLKDGALYTQMSSLLLQTIIPALEREFGCTVLRED